MPIKALPHAYHSVTPYITVHDAVAALDFYRDAFGAQETMRLPMGDRIGHAEIKIGDSHVMLSDEWPDMDVPGSKTRGGTTVSLMIYVEDADAAFDRAIKAGATVERPVADQFYGDRTGTLIDPFGHRWSLGTHIEDVSPEEIKRRMKSWSNSQSS